MFKPAPVILYIAPDCQHCPGMIKLTSEMLKSGKLSQLTIVNIALENNATQSQGIRSVPSLHIAGKLLTGVLTESEITQWLEKADSEDGLTEYYNHAFENGQLEEVIDDLDVKLAKLEHLLNMLCDLETPLTSRIAISAVFEHFEKNPALQHLIPSLCQKTNHDSESIRADVAHVLGLTGSKQAMPCLEQLARDTFKDVRETALEALEEIKQELA
jgi:hypothetical protein